VDYCAANAFLDAFAQRNGARADAYTLSINWDTWQEVGMAVNAGVPAEFKTLREDLIKRKGILPAEGAEAFIRLLGSALPQAVVSTQDLQAVIGQYAALSRSSLIEDLEKVSSARPKHSRPALKTPYAPSRNEIERRLIDIWEQILGVEPVGIADNFFELGGHSLLATQIVSRIRDTFQTQLPLRTFFDASTVAGLAACLGVNPNTPIGDGASRPLTIPRRSRTIDQELAELAQLSEDEAKALLSHLTHKEPSDE
jgi:acyl carrier protein